MVLYVLSNALFITVPLVLIFVSTYGDKTLECYEGLGSFRTHPCSIGEYVFDYMFFVVWLLAIIQPVLIAAAIITYLAMKYLQKNYKTIEKQRSVTKYLAATAIYTLAIIIGIFTLD